MSPNFDIDVFITVFIVVAVGIISDLRSKKPIFTKDHIVDWSTLVVALLWNTFGGLSFTIILGLIVTVGLARTIAGYIFEQVTKAKN